LTFVAVVGERATMAVVGVVLIVALVCAGSWATATALTASRRSSPHFAVIEPDPRRGFGRGTPAAGSAAPATAPEPPR